jgi:hypothetical protein
VGISAQKSMMVAMFPNAGKALYREARAKLEAKLASIRTAMQSDTPPHPLEFNTPQTAQSKPYCMVTAKTLTRLFRGAPSRPDGGFLVLKKPIIRR